MATLELDIEAVQTILRRYLKGPAEIHCRQENDEIVVACRDIQTGPLIPKFDAEVVLSSTNRAGALALAISVRRAAKLPGWLAGRALTVLGWFGLARHKGRLLEANGSEFTVRIDRIPLDKGRVLGEIVALRECHVPGTGGSACTLLFDVR
jgi:hypothetical protein